MGIDRLRPRRFMPSLRVRLALAIAVLASYPLGMPASAQAMSVLPVAGLPAGIDVRRETGLVNGLVVDRYTWRDSKGRPRSISLVRYGQTLNGQPRGGYANQITYQVRNAATGAWRTVSLNPPPSRGDAGFGYFVSHEWYRYFDAPVCADGTNHCTIASLHGQDDSPLGLSLPGSGSTTLLSATSAIHTFKATYPHWGTVDPIPNMTSVATPSDPARHRRYDLPVTIHWQVTKGRDYPLWSVTYDLRSIPADVVSVDLRGPYGWLTFDPGNRPLTSVQWADQYRFTTTAGSVSTMSGWTWNKLNTGARYNLLVAGAYEFGLVEAVPYSRSVSGSSYAATRGQTSANGAGCPDSGWRMPCDWEWTYQSVQYENFGTTPTRAKKLAWGTAPYVGTSATTDDSGHPFAGYPLATYRLWVTFDMSGGANTLKLAAAIH